MSLPGAPVIRIETPPEDIASPTIGNWRYFHICFNNDVLKKNEIYIFRSTSTISCALPRFFSMLSRKIFLRRSMRKLEQVQLAFLL